MVGHAPPAYPALAGPMGLTLTYNSQAPAGTPGLVGSYYNNDATIRVATFANKTPVMVRTDPSVNFNWAGPAPARGSAPTISWCPGPAACACPGAVSAPSSPTTTTGCRPGSMACGWPTASRTVQPVEAHCAGCVTLGLADKSPVPITAEYYERLGAADITVGVLGPVGPSGEVKGSPLLPSWLSPEIAPALPA